MLDRVTHRKNLRDELITILRMLTNQPPAIKGDLPAPGRARKAPAAHDRSDHRVRRRPRPA